MLCDLSLFELMKCPFFSQEERRYQSSLYFSSFYEGKREGLKATALAMKQDGEPLEKIARYTQLSIEVIKQL